MKPRCATSAPTTIRGAGSNLRSWSICGAGFGDPSRAPPPSPAASVRPPQELAQARRALPRAYRASARADALPDARFAADPTSWPPREPEARSPADVVWERGPSRRRGPRSTSRPGRRACAAADAAGAARHGLSSASSAWYPCSGGHCFGCSGATDRGTPIRHHEPRTGDKKKAPTAIALGA